MIKEPPYWCIEAKKTLIDMDMGVNELAKKLGMTRNHVSAVINGRVVSPNTQSLICNYLKIID